MEYLLNMGTMLCIYGILVLSANLTVGLANCSPCVRRRSTESGHT